MKEDQKIAGKPVFKPISCVEHDAELIFNPDKIAENVAVKYAEANSTGSYPLNFLARKDEVEHDLNFEYGGYRTYKVYFTIRVLQSAVCASGCIPYSIIR